MSIGQHRWIDQSQRETPCTHWIVDSKSDDQVQCLSTDSTCHQHVTSPNTRICTDGQPHPVSKHESSAITILVALCGSRAFIGALCSHANDTCVLAGRVGSIWLGRGLCCWIFESLRWGDWSRLYHSSNGVDQRRGADKVFWWGDYSRETYLTFSLSLKHKHTHTHTHTISTDDSICIL